MRNTWILSGVLMLLGISTLYGAADIQQAVRDYASFYRRNSAGKLDSFKACFAPEERGNIYALPLDSEKTGWGDAVIVNTNKYGNICEVKYHTGDPSNIEQVVLKQQNGEWFASAFYTANLHRKLQEECAGKLQQLAKALQVFSMINGGRYPSGNDAAGWEELWRQNLIKAGSDYTCPQCSKVYNYVGGKSIVASADSPLAWCNKHVENGNLSNVLLVSGKITAMKSPAAHMPSAGSASGSGLAPAAPQAPAYGAAPAMVAPDSKTPDDWQKGPDENWYVHYEDALAAAKRENKKILLLHTGSDWCGWCKKLAKDVLSNDEFKTFARNKLILLYFDSPSKRHPMGQSQRDHVKQTERALGVSGGYPCTFILNNDGQIMGRIGGYRNLDGYISALKKYVGDTAAAEPSAAPAAPQTPAASGWITAPARSNFAAAAGTNSRSHASTRNVQQVKSARSDAVRSLSSSSLSLGVVKRSLFTRLWRRWKCSGMGMVCWARVSSK